MGDDGKISLNNRTLGMSSDEYVGGSFLYGQNVNTRDSSKSFKLSNKLTEEQINTRLNGTIQAQIPVRGNDVFCFTLDGKIEVNNLYNSMSTDDEVGGPLWSGTSGYEYYNGILIGNTILGIQNYQIDRFTISTSAFDTGYGLFDTDANLVSNPNITTNANWTFGAGWTYSANGAVHTSGTAALSQSLTMDGESYYRVSIKMNGCTAGSCVVKVNGATVGTLNSSSDPRTVFKKLSTITTEIISLVPTTDFNGTIKRINVNEYNNAKVFPSDISITTAREHPILLNDAFLYIGSGGELDVIDRTTWTCETLGITDSSYDIVDMVEIGTSIVLFANNGYESKHYYWDGVSEAATETVDWKGKKVTRAFNDGSTVYALVEKSNRRFLYQVSGYDRSLIASNEYDGIALGQDKEAYRESQRFDFEAGYTNCLGYCDTKFVISSYNGVYTYGHSRPGLKDSRLKEFTVPGDVVYSVANTNRGLSIAYKHTIGSKTYNVIGYETEGKYVGSGYVITNPILRDNFSTEKAITKNKIGYICPSSANGNIKIYVNADDMFFWTFYVSGVITTPVAGAIYKDVNDNEYEFISSSLVDGAGTLTFRATNMIKPIRIVTGTLSKVSGTGQLSIDFTDFSNYILVKTISEDTHKYGEDLLFGKDFIDTYMPYRHKVKVKIEINSFDEDITPEVFDVGILSDMVNQDV